MGAALCLCPSGKDEPELRIDKPHRLSGNGAYRRSVGCDGFDVFLQTQSGAETREILSDEEREALRHGSARLPSGFYVGPDAFGDETESDEVEYYSRQLYGIPGSRPMRRRMNTATAAAFRSKLKEPSMSPKSKLLLLGTKLSISSELEDEARDKRGDFATCSDKTRSIEIEPISDGNPADDDMDAADDEEDEYFEYVRIIVPPGPCGVVFQTPTDANMPPTVERFERMYDGRKGTIENCQLVQKGSVLCSINDLDVTHIPLPDLLRALTLSSHVEREFVFRK